MTLHFKPADRFYENICFEVDFPWQTEVINCKANVQYLSAGRGSGKTSCVSRVKLLKEAMENVDGEYAFYSPSYEIAKREKDRIMKEPTIRTNIVESSNQPTPFIRFCSGSIIRYRSTILEDNLLGHHYNGIVLDEAHTHSERFIDNFVSPTLAAKRGWLLMMGQFDEMGEDGWVYKRFYLPGQKPNQDRFKSWIIPSSMGVMYSGKEGTQELESIRANIDPMTFRRQYLAQPVECANLAFRKSDLNESKVGEIVNTPKHGVPIIMAVDIGRVCDPTAWVVCQPLNKTNMAVLNCGIRPLGEKYEVQVIEIERIRAAYGARTVIIDSTGGGAGGHAVAKGVVSTDVFSAHFKRTVSHCRPYYFTRKTKSQGMQQLQLGFEQHRITIPAQLNVLHNQLAMYRWTLNRGFCDFHGPDGHSDDLVAALCMAYEATLRGWWTAEGAMSESVNSVLM